VTVTGGVPDIRDHLAEAMVVVVPLRYGSGARQKILEAWCMEKCVVRRLHYRRCGRLGVST
jgi:hypothetical protein